MAGRIGQRRCIGARAYSRFGRVWVARNRPLGNKSCRLGLATSRSRFFRILVRCESPEKEVTMTPEQKTAVDQAGDAPWSWKTPRPMSPT